MTSELHNLLRKVVSFKVITALAMCNVRLHELFHGGVFD